MKPIDKNISRINDLYNLILNETKKDFVSEVMLVPIDTQTYPNLRTDADTRFDQVNKPLLDDLQDAAESINATLTITTASSGHSSKTTSGRTSRHPSGEAVDISYINNYSSRNAKTAREVNSTFKSYADKLVDKLVSMGYARNVESGNPKSVLWFFNDKGKGGNHFNHIHVSNTSAYSSTAKKDDKKSSPENILDKFKNLTSKEKETSSVADSDSDAILTGKQQGGMYDVAAQIGRDVFGLKESKIYSSLGKNVNFHYGTATIPSNTNPKIKSAVDGVINNTKFSNSSCTNRVVIEHKVGDKKMFLEYCGITNPKVRNGASVSTGSLLGETDDDVEVNLYNSSWERKSLENYINKEMSSLVDDGKDKKIRANKDDSGGIAQVLIAPLKIFQDQPDEEGNIERRWMSPGEKGLPSFKSWDKLSPGRKLKENIDRIKGLIK